MEKDHIKYVRSTGPGKSLEGLNSVLSKGAVGGGGAQRLLLLGERKKDSPGCQEKQPACGVQGLREQRRSMFLGLQPKLARTLANLLVRGK